MQPDCEFGEDLEQQVRTKISQSLSPRHVPKHMFAVPKIPYNVNGKKLEVLVKRVISGQANAIDSRTKSTLVQEDDLDYFRQYVNVGSVTGKARAKL